MEEFLEKVINDNKFNMINNLMLTNREISVLERYNISYKKCNSLKEVIYEIEKVINELDTIDYDLEDISNSISERDYYLNTNK